MGGGDRSGAFLVIVDDGTGYPSTDLLSEVASAVDAVRPIGTTFAVVAPTVLTVAVSLVAEFMPPSTAASGSHDIKTFIASYLNGLAIGKPASVTKVAQQAYMANARLQNVTNIRLNGGFVDIAPPPQTVIKAGDIMVLPQ